MTDVLVTVVPLMLAAAAAWAIRGHRIQRAVPDLGGRRVLFPFLGKELSMPALEAALRLARAEHATLVPVYLAEVPLHLALDCPLPRQSAVALALLDAVEQRARHYGVAVDTRIEKGRDSRHALREMLAHERYDRIVLAAETASGGDGFTPEETAWLLANAPGEIVVLRPDRAHTQTFRERLARGGGRRAPSRSARHPSAAPTATHAA
ncbi:universal stress protein [Conexibacter sp. CPCC 206217]|uniref:universal stress protein n=1 Tax=Conexibacter sp. CPCC 206217 TaxID=3064574 RepID=UPI00271B1B6D|nr:universal stress protein [Conexibacter sp. CPCC 206217]MDO8213861.1 universal stress protein [Conexibacter sp. CPCC 206217]